MVATVFLAGGWIAPPLAAVLRGRPPVLRAVNLLWGVGGSAVPAVASAVPAVAPADPAQSAQAAADQKIAFETHWETLPLSLRPA